ncbi:MAG TPA: protein kinase [Kofleriaceae bacterium]|jgi:serine/threonine-protein kinase|nr:protein kinase [Kofleriaceae bacterium]
MPELREVELRIAVAEGVLSRAEADELFEEARRKKQSPLVLLVEQGRLSEDSFQSILAEAMNDPMVRDAGHDASASTYTMDAPLPASVGDPPFPVAGWDRYTCVRFLGQGGMGMVFLAVDARLRREVAIKFVRGSDADHVRRLISEARNQARVSHERICKVYEVGEVEGKVYIAMQYIAGKPLGRMADELTLEQKVMLVRGAAEGVHAAHSEGIIHRDVKPSNIMVERGDDGELRPCVMDFGLARSAQDASETMTGAVVGTPRYMSPEQAQGATSKLDRRADVYSLGATLYHLLTGQPVFPGETVAEVIHQLIDDEPRPLRAHDPGIPVDLEAIVLKCLEKDRSARYDSARGLAEDLGRFLTGEPVVARRAGTWYRLRKRLAKHRQLVAVAAAALVALVVAIGWAIRTRLESAEREQFARQFTEEVASIESTARYSALSPLHDIRGDRKAIRAKMDEIDAEMKRGGELAAGPGHYALGRGYLALDDDAHAREQLGAAWNGGFREPRVAFALAQVMGQLYQQNLLAAERIEDREAREARKREIGWRYRAPALGFLSQTASSEGAAASEYAPVKDVAPPEYVAALVAYYEGRVEDALGQLDRIGGGLPWFYEAPKLRGDILFARVLGFRNSGDDERARRDFGAGRQAYARAAGIGRSVSSIYESVGEFELAEMVMELYGHGDVMPAATRALDAAAQALATEPDHYEALVLDARVHRSVAEHKTIQGLNAEALLGQALASADRAVKLSPRRTEARLETAKVYRQWGSYRAEHSDDPTDQFRQAISALDGLSAEDRDDSYYLNRGLAFSMWAHHEDETGRSGEAHRDQSIAAYTQGLRYAEAIHRKDQQRNFWIDVGINWFERATVSRASDPDGDLQQAIIALEKAKAIDPHNYVPYFYEGQTYEAMAQRSRARGRDPGADLHNALDAYHAGLDINSTIAHLHNGTGGVFQALASRARDHGEDPVPLLDKAQSAFAQAIKVAGEQGFGYANLGEVYIQRAQLHSARGEDPRTSANQAVEALRQAVDKMPNHPTFRADLAMAHTIIAAYELEHGRDPQPSIRSAVDALQPSVDSNSSDAQVRVYLAETRGLSVRLAARHGRGNSADFEQVAHAFEQSIALAPDNPDYQIVFASFCRAWAMFARDTGSDSRPAVACGTTQVNRALASRPGCPDALVMRASLALVQAQSAHDSTERRAQAERSRQDFTAAFTADHALENVWAGEAALAQQFARQ